MALSKWLFRATTAAGLVGVLVGFALAIGAEQFDRFTNTDEFCTSCHLTGEYIAKSETYQKSSHRTRAGGVRPGCSDCHIPKGLVRATWVHTVKGIRDLYGQFAYDYEDPAVWEERRPELAHAVRYWMRSTDSTTCRSCHDEAAITPARLRGQRQHEEARETGMTCIDCHYNLVHDEVEPTEAFLESAGRQQ